MRIESTFLLFTFIILSLTPMVATAGILDTFGKAVSTARMAETAIRTSNNTRDIAKSTDKYKTAKAMSNIVCAAAEAPGCAAAEAATKVGTAYGHVADEGHRLDNAAQDGYAALKEEFAKNDGVGGYRSTIEATRDELSSHQEDTTTRNILEDSSDAIYAASKTFEWFEAGWEKIHKFGSGINIDFGYFVSDPENKQATGSARDVGLPDSTKQEIEAEKERELARQERERKEREQRMIDPYKGVDFCSIPYAVYARRFPPGRAPARYECPNG